MPIEVLHPDQLHYKAKNHSGRKQGRLEFLLPLEKRSGGNIVWLCVCSCGALTEVSTAHIDRTKSCGCFQKDRASEANSTDITGETFGRLTAIHPTNERLGSHILWLCQCECGNTKKIAIHSLTGEQTRSCGCWQKEGVAERNRELSGPDNPNWKGGVTPARQRARTNVEYREWRETVFQRDDYTCQNCQEAKSGYLNAHHILPFALHPKYRYDVDNGVTLCEDCHKDFHEQYGRKYCDRVDLIRWLND